MFPHHALVKKKLFFQTFVMTLIIKISPGNPSGLTENCTLKRNNAFFSAWVVDSKGGDELIECRWNV